MYELNQIDRKIIYELGKDARQSYRQIAKNIKSKKEVVAYHINELVSKGVISKFVPVFALSKLGILSHKIYIRLQGLDASKEDKLINELVKNKKVAWVAKSVGKWDLLLVFYAKNIVEFGKIKDEILFKLGKYIEDYDVTFIEDAFVLNRDYMFENNKYSRKEFSFAGQFGNEKIEDLDLEIISLIKNNGRKSVVDIANELNIDARTVNKRLKDLNSRGILQGQTIFLDLDKLGFQLHKLCITMKNYNTSSFKELVSYCKQNKNVVHVVKSLGSWEFELELEENNVEHIYEYIRLLKNEFVNIIRHIDLVTITNELKLKFFPADLKNQK